MSEQLKKSDYSDFDTSIYSKSDTSASEIISHSLNLFEDKELRDKLSNKGSKLVREKYDSTLVARELSTCYFDIRSAKQLEPHSAEPLIQSLDQLELLLGSFNQFILGRLYAGSFKHKVSQVLGRFTK